MDRSQLLVLVSLTYTTTDEIGQQIPMESRRTVFCNISSVSQAEINDAGRSGLSPEYRATVYREELGGKSFTFAANNSISNSGARYMGVLLGATDVMIEAEITANMDSVNSVNIEVFDSKGRSSGTHQIVFQKPTSPEPAEPKPVTTTPVQQNQVGNDQKTQSSTPAQGDGNSSAGDTGKTNAGYTDTIAGDTSVVPHSDSSNTSSNEDTATTGDSEDITSDMTPKNYLFPKMILGITISACAMICGIVYKRRRDRKNKTFGN